MNENTKRPYVFGEYEVLDFESLMSDYSPDLKNLAIYARIPIPTGDCNDGALYMTPADLCMAIN